MTDPLRKAAQALLDSLVGEDVPDSRLSRVELDLRRALASPAPSTSTADDTYGPDGLAHGHKPCGICGGVRCAGCDEEPAPSPSRDAARDDALEEAARYFDGAEWEDPNEWFPPGHVAKWLRSLKGQPPPAAPADQSKETPHDP